MDRIERSAAVEATQEARAAADTLAHRIRGWDNTEQHKEDVAAILEYRQAAFNAGRASVLAELESPTEAMALSGVASFTFSKNDLQQVKAIFTAMIGAYKEAL